MVVTISEAWYHPEAKKVEIVDFKNKRILSFELVKIWKDEEQTKATFDDTETYFKDNGWKFVGRNTKHFPNYGGCRATNKYRCFKCGFSGSKMEVQTHCSERRE